MVEFKSKIYYEEDNQIIGAEITVYSEEGDRIVNIKVTNEDDYNYLVNQIETLSEDFVSIDNLQSEIDKLNIDSNTLNGFSSADFARHDHNHGDIYVPKSHSTIIADASNYGHVKIIDNLTRDNLYTGESLSAHQGKILSDMINNLQNDLKTWNSRAVGLYGTLKINTAIRCCRFNYNRKNYTVNGDKTLHTGAIPAAYRPTSTVKVPNSKHIILSVNSAGDINLSTSYSGTITSNLLVNFIWFY